MLQKELADLNEVLILQYTAGTAIAGRPRGRRSNPSRAMNFHLSMLS
jgi:hypothetical protein